VTTATRISSVPTNISEQKALATFHYLCLPDQVPFQDNSFSGMLVSEVLHFFHHPDVILSVWELYHFLIAPRGKVALTCTCEDMPVFKKNRFEKIKMEERQN